MRKKVNEEMKACLPIFFKCILIQLSKTGVRNL